MKAQSVGRTLARRWWMLPIIIGGIWWPALAQDPVSAWEAQYRKVLEAYRSGSYRDAIPIAQQALSLARHAFGERDIRTVNTMIRLAALLNDQGRYGEAEPLFRQALQVQREVLGNRHPDTLGSINNLAMMLWTEGRNNEAEPLAREALQLRREVLGSRHPDTLDSMEMVALILRGEGRLGEGEPLLRESLQIRREILGPRNPDTLNSMNSLAAQLQLEGQSGEAEPLFREQLRIQRQILGPRHHDTLVSMGNLAELLAEKGEHREAELLFREILQVERERLGPRHPDTLGSMQRLAGVLQDEGRVNEAERLAREALRLKREVLGSRHPDTLSSMEQLAIIWQLQGRYSESDVLYPELLKGSMETFGAAHPNTLLTQLRRVANLAAQGHVKEAVAPLREMEPNLLTWLGVELYTTQAVAVRRRFVASQSIYQDSALSLALLAGAPEEAVELAASVVLHFKELAVEEETFLAHLVRHGSDPRIRELASTIAGLHDQLARVFHTAGSRDQVPRLTAELDAKELELSRLSRGFAQTLQVRTATLHELRNKLPSGSGLLEIRLYYPVDFKTLSEPGEARCAGILITSTGVIQVKDLGTVAAAAEAVDALVNKASSEEARDRATRALYGQLITPFAKEIAELDRLYVAPDGGFYLVPLGALRGPDGHRLLEVKDVRLIQTGRDLLRAPPEQQGRGLLAMGGIDFGPVPTSEMQPPVAQSVRHQLQAMPVAEAMRPRQQVRAMGWSLDAGMIEHLRAVTADNLRGGFGPLPRSREEVEGIGLLYGAARPDEPPPEVIIGDRATKARLTELGAPPRVVHLATHGFYRAGREPADRPLLLSGIAFAGANRALHDPDQGGILYAIEALDLNLEGTELVVLSACETAQGQIEYGEGVSGMVRALRTAGARSVLVTLRPVDDAGAADFMQLFYHHWLSQVHDDLAAALRDTQRDYLKPNTARSDDPIWSSFILIGG